MGVLKFLLFTQLYMDLKSFYYLDYYSAIVDPAEREITVRVKGARGKVRHRAIN